MHRVNNVGNEVQDTAVSVLAASSKTPFSTAFKVTLGIGAARLLLFVGGVSAIATAVIIYGQLTK